jgi:hypothetical protein
MKYWRLRSVDEKGLVSAVYFSRVSARLEQVPLAFLQTGNKKKYKDIPQRP